MQDLEVLMTKETIEDAFQYFTTVHPEEDPQLT